MKPIHFYLSLACLFFIFSSGCESFDNLKREDNLFGSVKGKVSNVSGIALVNVSVSIGQLMTSTDNNGNFEVVGVPVGDRVIIEFTLDGFISNYRILEVREDIVTYARASLIREGTKIQISAQTGGTISFQGAKITLPPDALVDEDGNFYTGSAEVSASYMDPTTDYYLDVFPGDFEGLGLNGEEGPIESYGFISVEISGNGHKLNLSPEHSAGISIPIPASIMNKVPQQVPLWFFDTQEGKWIEEGSAVIQGNAYSGSVGHFSFWNADKLFIDEISTISGRVVDQDGVPINSPMILMEGVDFEWVGALFGSLSGVFQRKVKSNSTIEIEAGVHIDRRSYWSSTYTFTTADPGGSKDIGDIVVIIDESILNINKIETEKQEDVPDVVKENSISLFGVHFIDENKGWISGGLGTILHTSNGGTNWQLQANSSGVSNLRDIYFTTALKGFAVGSSGVGLLLKTENAGNVWETIQNQDYSNMKDIFFLNENLGWIIAFGNSGQIILKTIDGGKTWTEGTIQNSASMQGWVNSLHFVNSNSGWAVGAEGLVLKTEDGGENWFKIDVGVNPTLVDFESISMIDNQNIWLCGTETICHSNDGGSTWDIHNMDEVFQKYYEVNNFSYIQAFQDKVWAVGDFGIIINSTDEGATWGITQTADKNNLQSAFFLNSNLGWAVGYDGRILKISTKN